jgi:hypothetical protein
MHVLSLFMYTCAHSIYAIIIYLTIKTVSNTRLPLKWIGQQWAHLSLIKILIQTVEMYNLDYFLNIYGKQNVDKVLEWFNI